MTSTEKPRNFHFAQFFWKSGCSNVHNPPAEKAQHVLNLKDFLDMLELLVIKLTVHTQNLTKWFETIRCPYGCNTRKVVRTFSQEEKKWRSLGKIFSIYLMWLYMNKMKVGSKITIMIGKWIRFSIIFLSNI